MRSLLALALFGAVVADKSDFPKFDATHCNCEIKVTYPNSDCDQIWTDLETTIKSFANGGPSGGLYAIYEDAEDDYVWTTRTTPTHHYVDDIIFEVTQDGDNCNVDCKSRSETTSLYDYDTNYCNIWNVLTHTDTFTDLQTSHCLFVPSNPQSTCATY